MELDDFAALRAEFTARGWHRKATGAVLGELAVHVTVALVGYGMFLLCDEALWRMFGLVVSTYGTLGVATNTHTSTHYGTSEKRWVNDLFSYFGYPFFLSLSATYWRNAHIVIHHTSPNVMGVDDDHDFMPHFATTEREIAGTSGLRRFYHEHIQAWFFPIIMWVHVFLRQKASWSFLLRALLDPSRRRRAHWIDLGCMIGYWLFWIGVPCLFFSLSVGEALLAVAIRIACIGYPLFAILAPAHYPHEAGCVRRGEWPKDFLALQTCTTVNYRTGSVGGFICSGLQYQIEHHLFPNFSHVYYPRMAPHVKAFCERNGYPYRSMSWGRALLKTMAIFSRPKPEAPDLDTLRARLENNPTP